MRVKTLSMLAGVMLASGLSGCIVPVVGPRDPYWDGHAYVAVREHTHCAGCGHYYYDNGWNQYPANHVYVQAGYSRHSRYHGGR